MEPRIDFEVYPAGKGSRFMRLLPGVLSARALDRLRLRLFALPSRFGALTQERTHA
jgi:hypothetical protein